MDSKPQQPAPLEQALQTLTQDELTRLYQNFSHYRDSVCGGMAKLSVGEFLKQYGLTQAYTTEPAGAKADERETIHVAFRKFPEGDVIALWGRPDEHGMISSYQHVGQHSDASCELLEDLPRANPGEYLALRTELMLRGYNVLRELELYSINGADGGDTLLCLECASWEEADSIIPADLRDQWEFGECYLGFSETFRIYDVYKLPEQAAEAVAHIRRGFKEA